MEINKLEKELVVNTKRTQHSDQHKNTMSKTKTNQRRMSILNGRLISL